MKKKTIVLPGRYLMVFFLVSMILVNKCVLQVNADEIVKSRGYRVNDIEQFFRFISDVDVPRGENVLDGTVSVGIDLSSYDLSYLEGLSYVITVSGTVSESYLAYSSCDWISDGDASVKLSVNDRSFVSDSSVSENVFTASYRTSEIPESLKLNYNINKNVYAQNGGIIGLTGFATFSDLSVKIMWEEEENESTDLLAIIRQPVNNYVFVGDIVKFRVSAQGSGLTYQWQYRSSGGSEWKNSGMTGNKTDCLSVQATTARDGQMYRCIITDANGNETISDAVGLYLNTEVEVPDEPLNPDSPSGSDTPSSPVTGNFVSLMTLVINFMQMEFDMGGFVFSYWQIMILACLAGIIGSFLYGLFH